MRDSRREKSTAAADPKTRLALSEFQKSASLQPTGVVNEETIAALRTPAEPIVDLHDRAAGCRRSVHRSDADGHDGKRQAAGAGVYVSARGARREISREPGAAANAQSWCDVDGRRSDQSAGRRAVRAAVASARKQRPRNQAASQRSKWWCRARRNRSSCAMRLERVLMYAPVTIGSSKDPLPVGDWKVVGVSWNPTFNYNPDLFWDADPTHAKAKIPAGPNNPVGVVWVDINKEHFGLHGTPEPSTIGRTESHGCIRLTNWDATRLGRLVSVGDQSHDSMTIRHRRRSVHAEAIAPWVALSVVLLIWWAGAKALNWARPGHQTPLDVRLARASIRPCRRSKPVDDVPPEPARGATRCRRRRSPRTPWCSGPTSDELRRRSLAIPVRGLDADDLVSSFARCARKQQAARSDRHPRAARHRRARRRRRNGREDLHERRRRLDGLSVRSVRDVRLLLRASRQLRAGVEGRR